LKHQQTSRAQRGSSSRAAVALQISSSPSSVCEITLATRNSRSKSNQSECSTRVLAAVYISKFNQLLANGFLFSSALPRI
jgi:hypothetical protein